MSSNNHLKLISFRDEKLKNINSKIFEKQYLMYRDTDLYERLITMSLKLGFFGIPRKDFRNKVVLDAGCGSIIYITEA